MAVNADPKPGRWILPLVVLGMVAFTYFFVRALPSGSEEANGTDTTLSASDTTLANGEETPGDAPSTTAVAADPETQAYFEGLDTILATMEELQAEMSAVNSGFDADPRTVAYSDAVDRLTALETTADEMVAALDGLTPPDAVATNHETIRTSLTTAAGAAGEALEGLTSEDDGSRRRDAATAFDTAVTDLRTAVENARSAAGLAVAPADTTDETAPPDTTDTTSTPETTEAAEDA